MAEVPCVRWFPKALAAAAASGLILGGASARAGDDAGADASPHVTVTAPHTIEKDRDGVISQLVTMSIAVPYGDLNLRTAEGVAELNKRVAKAADYVCVRLKFLYPTGDPEPFDCANRAVKDARPQVIKASAG